MEKQNKVNGWKITAIIFIVLFVLLAAYMIWAYNIGVEYTELDNKCAYEICEDYASYYYDAPNHMCSCYENHEVVVNKYIK